MKTIKITYWVTTVIVALMMFFSTYSYLTKDEMRQAFHHLGYPDYFRIELAVAKFIGAVFLLVPVGARIKEWIYAGFAVTFISAFIAHTVAEDPASVRIMPLIFLVLLVISYTTYHKLHKVVI
jgi:hypothetical protein